MRNPSLPDLLLGLIQTINTLPLRFGMNSLDKQKVVEKLKRLRDRKINNEYIDAGELQNVLEGAKHFIRRLRDDVL